MTTGRVLPGWDAAALAEIVGRGTDCDAVVAPQVEATAAAEALMAERIEAGAGMSIARRYPKPGFVRCT